VEEKMIRSVRVVMRYFKCKEKGHKCRECPLWERKEKRVVHPVKGKAHQEERRPTRPVREKAHEGERRLRRVEFMGGVEEESRVVLWTSSTTRCRIMGAGIAWPKGHNIVFKVSKV